VHIVYAQIRRDISPHPAKALAYAAAVRVLLVLIPLRDSTSPAGQSVMTTTE
jgi:hypothetical protein